MPDAYSTAVLANAPQAYYRLNDGTTAIADSSGNAHGLTAGTSVTLGSTGLLNQAISTDKAVTLPTTPTSALGCVTSAARVAALEATTALTLECWFKATSLVAGVSQMMLSYGSNATNLCPYRLAYYGDTNLIIQFLFQLNIGAARNTAGGAYLTYVAAATIYHLVGVYNGTDMRLYINGALVDTKVIGGSIGAYGTGGLTLGSDSAFSQPPCNGVLDEVAIYPNVALSAATVLAHYNAGTVAAVAASPRPLRVASQAVKRASFF